MEADFCVETLKEALAKYGPPDIMNSDQGSQFTGFEWINALTEAGVKISMDGRGRWIDNRMIERLWRSLKYECVYLNAFETGSEARAGIGKWLAYYDAERPHSTHGILTVNGRSKIPRMGKLKFPSLASRLSAGL
jgi:putative transposase